MNIYSYLDIYFKETKCQIEMEQAQAVKVQKPVEV